MSYPGFARPDLCSIRTADEQDELAKAVHGGFSAMTRRLEGLSWPGAPETVSNVTLSCATSAALLDRLKEGALCTPPGRQGTEPEVSVTGVAPGTRCQLLVTGPGAR